jgi:hypothetical protein
MPIQVDPYGGQYLTAGDPFITVNGDSLEMHRTTDPQGTSRYYDTYGTLGPQVWAEDQNRILLASGAALQTSAGLISMNTALAAIQAKGYRGPTDAASVAQAYALLVATPPTNTPPVTAGGGGVPGLPNIPPLALAAGAAIGLWLFFGGGMRRNPSHYRRRSRSY